jgi:hypothetical protein
MAAHKSAGVVLQAVRGAPAQALVVLRKGPEGFAGRLELREKGGDFVREMSAGSCDELGSALAFVLGLAVLEEYGKEEEPIPAPPVCRPPPALPAPSFDAWVGGSIGARGGLAPGLSVTELVFVELRGARAPKPALRLGAARAEQRSGTGADYRWEISWTAARVEGCPAAIEGSGWRVAPCLGVNVGAVRSSGFPLAGRGATETGFWLEPLAALRVEARPAEAVSIHLGLEAFAPLYRYEFAFENPATPVYRMPVLAAAGSLGLALRIR